jgi:hypothetical protein
MAVHFGYRVEYTKMHFAEEVSILAVYIVTNSFTVLGLRTVTPLSLRTSL